MQSAFGIEHFSKLAMKKPPTVKKKVKINAVNGTTRMGTLTPTSTAMKVWPAVKPVLGFVS